MKFTTQFLIMCDYMYRDGLREYPAEPVPVLVVPSQSEAEKIIGEINADPHGEYGRIALAALETDKLPAGACFSACSVAVAATADRGASRKPVTSPPMASADKKTGKAWS